jgi:hypothetical protein
MVSLVQTGSLCSGAFGAEGSKLAQGYVEAWSLCAQVAGVGQASPGPLSFSPRGLITNRDLCIFCAQT